MADKLETVDIPGVEIFAVGTHNGQPYTGKDLDDMVAAFTALTGEYAPPVKLGHSEKQPALEDVPEGSAPAFGWVAALRRVGDKLVADLSAVPATLGELIKTGAYRYRSAEIWWDLDVGETTYRRVLKAVAFLGDTMPAVRTLKDIYKLYRTHEAFAADDKGQQYQPVLFAVKDDDGADDGLTIEDIEDTLNDLAVKLEKDLRFKAGAPTVRAFLTDIKRRLKGYVSRSRKDAPMTDKMAADAAGQQDFSCQLLKTEVAYQVNAGVAGKSCGDCRWFQRWGGMDGAACAVVEGRIAMADVCDRFEAMPPGLKPGMGMYSQDSDAGDRQKGEGTVTTQNSAPAGVTVQEFDDLKARLAASEAKTQTYEAENGALKGKVDSLSADVTAARTRELTRWASDTVANWYGDRDANRTFLLSQVKAFGQDSDEVRAVIAREDGHMKALKAAGVFSERGADGEPAPAAPASEFEAEVKKHTDAGKSRAQAITAVATANPALYKAYSQSVVGEKITY